MSGFIGLKKYQDFCRRDWYEKGYILLNPLTGHRAHIYDWEKLRKIERRLTYDFYAVARRYKDQENKSLAKNQKPVVNYITDKFAEGVSPTEIVGPFYYQKKKGNKMIDVVYNITIADAYRYPIKYFFKRKSASEKQSINYRIQASGSMCLRVTLVNFFTWICNNDLFGKVKICIPPYDEINCEAPAEIAEEVAQRLYQDMVDAGAIFCTRCKLDADMSRLEDGSLPNYWIH